MTTSTVFGPNSRIYGASVTAPYARALFYAVGRFWAFYFLINPSEYFYTSSTDGINWTPTTSFTTNRMHWDGTYVHTYRSGFYYRRGIPQSDGTIAWENETLITSGSGGYANTIVDSEGYPWVAYARFISPEGYRYFCVRAINTEGTSWESPTQMWTPPPAGYHGQIIPLTNRKMYFIGSTVTSYLWGFYFDGTSWQTTPTVIDTIRSDNSGQHSSVSIGDKIYLIYQKADLIIYFKTWTPTEGWSSSVKINEGTHGASGLPTISNDANIDLYVFWPYGTLIKYRKLKNLTTWEDPQTLVDNGATITGSDFTSSYLSYFAKIQLLWIDGPLNNRRIRHDWLSVPYRRTLSETLRIQIRTSLGNITFSQAYQVITKIPAIKRLAVYLKERIQE